MMLWAIAATAAALILAALLILYRRQVGRISRQLKFMKKNRTNLRLSQSAAFPELDSLTAQINTLLDQNRDSVLSTRRNEEALRDLITNLSHDIRTPLTSLDGYVQLLSQSTSPQETEHYLSVIQGRIRTLRNILEMLFTYARLQNGQYTFSLEKINFSACVSDTIFSFYDEFKGLDITPVIEISDEVLFVNGNHDAIERTLLNIIKNSFEHGVRRISLSLSRDGEEAVFRCANDVAHPEDIQPERLFERFYKADSSRYHSSSGLGLPIARELTERMGGTLTAALDGHTFRMELRLKLWNDTI